jgi:hypothetical protein
MKIKFKKIKKRKTYPTWVSKTRIKGCKIYILCMLMKYGIISV